ncbi:GNAT family N-acetyltransferase [Aeromonas hydrophila]|uniref:GNAT family N-acetyltransferase n=1 Tax=Aeromonas hydrophila TaxID=644 RepID=UPI00207C7A9E|nr:GNAT family N-acetyltransferase [Aeromonas hydrophila]MCO4207481.1 GNAT family N-acetyltransferase [Aeromonas hydrophila]
MPTPLIRLLPMSEQHYPAYCACFIEEYAQDLASNQGHDLATARHKAEASLQRYLPQGVASAGHSLLCILPADAEGSVVPAEGEPLGYLWHAIDSAATATFIYDFYVAPAHRSRGIGKAAMALPEAELRSCGICQITLRVAHDNPRALALYQEAGFAITGYNMAKRLG